MSGEPTREEIEPVLGTCPCCAGSIPPAYLLAHYETADGWPRMFAECPGCETVVQPA